MVVDARVQVDRHGVAVADVDEHAHADDRDRAREQADGPRVRYVIPTPPDDEDDRQRRSAQRARGKAERRLVPAEVADRHAAFCASNRWDARESSDVSGSSSDRPRLTAVRRTSDDHWPAGTVSSWSSDTTRSCIARSKTSQRDRPLALARSMPMRW